MAGSFPYGGVHQNGAVHAYIIGVLLNKFFPPSAADIAFQFRTQGAVVPSIGETAVNFTAGVYKTAPLGKGDDFFHGFFCWHGNPFVKT
jgi:hypothetical protein